jgi:hypothetical protein
MRRVALLFLPVVVTERPEDYDDWACRQLGRWLAEAPGTTVEGAADLADSLVEFKREPSAMDGIKTAAGVS